MAVRRLVDDDAVRLRLGVAPVAAAHYRADTLTDIKFRPNCKQARDAFVSRCEVSISVDAYKGGRLHRGAGRPSRTCSSGAPRHHHVSLRDCEDGEDGAVGSTERCSPTPPPPPLSAMPQRGLLGGCGAAAARPHTNTPRIVVT